MPDNNRSTSMRRRFTVEVTQDDLDAALKNSSTHCAVATAISHSIKGAYRPLVDIQTVRFSIDEDKRRYVYLTPKEVQDYIIAFDAGDPVKPFTFTLFRMGWSGPVLEGTGERQKNVKYVATLNVGREDSPEHKDVPLDVPVAGHSGTGRSQSGPPRSRRDREFGVRHMRRNQTGR